MIQVKFQEEETVAKRQRMIMKSSYFVEVNLLLAKVCFTDHYYFNKKYIYINFELIFHILNTLIIFYVIFSNYEF